MPNKSNLLLKEKTQKQNRIWVRIASACNNKCIFCLDSDAQNGTLPEEDDVKKQIQEWYKSNYENRIIISWGEASINPKFTEYIRYAKEIGYDRIQTVTNGNMFASELFCKRVFDAGLEEVTFSFHGHNSTLHDYLVATPWAFQKSLKGIIFIKKYYPSIIINIDIVVNKINVKFLPDIVRFFMRLWVYEFDILQIIPFGRWFSEFKDQLFYDVNRNISSLHDTWKLSRISGMYMWTNRFPAEAFEWYEDLIQDPRKIKSEVMGESYDNFEPFIRSQSDIKPHCFGEACSHCFLNQYCFDFIKNKDAQKLVPGIHTRVISGEEFPSQVYDKYWFTGNDFKMLLHNLAKDDVELINIPKCMGGSGKYQTYNDLKKEWTLEEYTSAYINNLYLKKSLRCGQCKYTTTCKGIHINFIRSYWFQILQPIE